MALMLSGLALPAWAGQIDAAIYHFKLTFDDADWKTADGDFPLRCINPACKAISCSVMSHDHPETDAERAADVKTAEANWPLLDMKIPPKLVKQPKITSPGATTGVSWITRYETGIVYSFDFTTGLPTERAALECQGATTNGKPMEKLFEKLLSGIEIH